MFKFKGMPKTNTLNGWVEILHWNTNVKDRLSNTKFHGQLQHFKPEDYSMVGSPVPLVEYFSVFGIYKQFTEKIIDEEFNIPRSLAAYDAINLCINEPRTIGRLIKTYIIIPKDAVTVYAYPGARAEYHPSFPMILLPRPSPFRSFKEPNFGKI